MVLSSDKKDILILFLDQMDVIRRCRLFKRRRKRITVSIHISPKGMTSSIKNLQMDELRSALASLRQFHGEGEKITLNRVCNLLEKANLDANSLLWIRAARATWRRTLQSCPSHYYVGNRPLLVANAMDLFFNAVVFHADADKVRKWKELAPDERNFHIYSVYVALPYLFWSLSTVDTIIDTILNHPRRKLPAFPTARALPPAPLGL
jgi:hypothetical protein